MRRSVGRKKQSVIAFLQTPLPIHTTNRKFYLIFFVVAFAFIFLNLYQPFGLYYSNNLKASDVFIELFVALLVAFMVLLFSQFVLRSMLRLHEILVWQFLILFMIESIITGSAWFMLDYFTKGIMTSVFYDWLTNILGYILIIALPYFSFAFILSLRDSAKVINPSDSIPNELSFRDENGVVRMIVKTADVLFIQSADNYVELHYREDQKTNKLLLRTTIKKLENELSHSPLLRCHRSFMVNTGNITSAHKVNSGFTLRVESVDAPIPVSQSYLSELKKHINI